MRVRTCVRTILAGVLALHVAQAAGAADAPKTPAADPWQRYVEYLQQTRNGDVRPYLTDEGQAQFAGFTVEEQNAARGFLYSLPGLHDAAPMKSKVDGQRATLEGILYFVLPGSQDKDVVQARVEMAITSRGWSVVRETLTPPESYPYYSNSLRDSGWTSDDGRSWTGLRAPGVFPPSIKAKAAAEVRDQKGGDGWAINDVRSVISGEAAYQSANAGYYDRLECLRKGATCIPGYPANGPWFLDPDVASARNGYTPRFDPGPAAKPEAGASRSSIVSYAFWMIPDAGRPGRTICGDGRGIVCTVEGRTPPVTQGECPAEPGPCRPLR